MVRIHRVRVSGWSPDRLAVQLRVQLGTRRNARVSDNKYNPRGDFGTGKTRACVAVG